MTTSRSMGDLFGGATSGGWLNMRTAHPHDDPAFDIGVIGIGAATPYPLGAYCMDAPDAIRRARSWPGILDHHDFDIHGVTPSAGVLPPGVTAADFGNLDVRDSAAAKDTAYNRELITTTIRAMRAKGTIPIIFGGDDSIPVPVLAGYDEPLSILQIDAHIDWRDNVGGESLGLSSNMRRASEMEHIGKIVQLGARGIGSARADDLHDALAYGTS
ncbi:MAG: arginase family protein, partial [Alphaproteobacteria bacterium]|nr:arginase family protein [Alphaproteobacteria bacterium]